MTCLCLQAHAIHERVHDVRLMNLSAEVIAKVKSTLCPPQNIPDIFDCNVKKDYRILIIFDANITDTTGHQMTV